MDEGAPLFRLISPYMENGEIYSYLLNRQPPPNMVLRLRLVRRIRTSTQNSRILSDYISFGR